jgi:predicted CXXCH cytochrome family protein
VNPVRRKGNIGMWILLALAILVLSQCSPHAGKSLLSIFFDGVPGADSTNIPGSELTEVQSDSMATPTDPSEPGPPLVFIHYPYGERECETCHDPNALGNMVEPQPGLCYMCHEDLTTSYKYLHGPVAGGYCTACHDPHMSDHEKFLRFTGEKLCFHCHSAASVFKNDMHTDLAGMECADCHNAHGGEDKYILH